MTNFYCFTIESENEQWRPIDLTDCGSFIAIEQADVSEEEDFHHCILVPRNEIDNLVLRLQAMKK